MAARYFIGLMSGTSMDGVDGVIVRFIEGEAPYVMTDAHCPFDSALRVAMFALQTSGDDEIHRESLAANQLAAVYAQCCGILLSRAGLQAKDIVAVGAHGQTIRHRPDLGYTRQTNQGARLAELIGIDVIADFRSRDVAAGGQGAPLVPAFHATVFGAPGEVRVICNIGGISNLSILNGQEASQGFDCGPGNALMDAWVERQLGEPFDKDGRYAAQGRVSQDLLHLLEQEPFLSLPPPKSTGRDLFNTEWLDSKLAQYEASIGTQLHGGRLARASGDAQDTLVAQTSITPEDVQATLTAFTARAIAFDVLRYAPMCDTVFVCGGGAYNPVLLTFLEKALNSLNSSKLADSGRAPMKLASTEALGVPAQQVEALAFAWLAMRFVDRLPGNVPAATGAAGMRTLGALYPA